MDGNQSGDSDDAAEQNMISKPTFYLFFFFWGGGGGGRCLDLFFFMLFVCFALFFSLFELSNPPELLLFTKVDNTS